MFTRSQRMSQCVDSSTCTSLLSENLKLILDNAVIDTESESGDRDQRIPFSINTNHAQLGQSDKQANAQELASVQNKENSPLGHKHSISRIKHKLSLNTNNNNSTFNNLNNVTSSNFDDLNYDTQFNFRNLISAVEKCVDRPVTPSDGLAELANGAGHPSPITPTANLKMLMSAVSPELRNRDFAASLLNQNTNTNDCDDLFKEIAGGKKLFEEFENEVVIDIEFETENVTIKQKKVTSKRKAKRKDAVLESDRNSDETVYEDEDDDMISSQESDAGKCPGGRKEKSLGLICQKFLSRYPDYPSALPSIEINLDGVAKELQIERRRIYDIVNVLESVEMASRIAKNRYAWHGKANLVTTLAKLKALALVEGFDKKIDNVKRTDAGREVNMGHQAEDEHAQDTQPYDSINNKMRKDKSLGIMSQRFLMLFLVSKPGTVNLDLAAKILIGELNIDKAETSKFKTKIRRLYDIANVLTSLGLIRKVHVTEVRGRKPAFKYIGPDVDDISRFTFVCSNDGHHRPSSRHSMLDCVQNKINNIIGSYGYRPLKPFEGMIPEIGCCSTGAEVTESRPAVATRKKLFSRHSSFDQICRIAETERNKLYSSSSQPCTPTKHTEDSDIIDLCTDFEETRSTIFSPGAPLSDVSGQQLSVGASVSSVSGQQVTTTTVSAPQQHIILLQKVSNGHMHVLKTINAKQLSPGTLRLTSEDKILKLPQTVIDKLVASLNIPNEVQTQTESNPAVDNSEQDTNAGITITLKTSNNEIEGISRHVDIATQSSPLPPTKIIRSEECEAAAASSSALSQFISPPCGTIGLHLKTTNEKTPMCSNSQVILASNPGAILNRRSGKRFTESNDGATSKRSRHFIGKDNGETPKASAISTPQDLLDAEVEAISNQKCTVAKKPGKPSPLRALHLQPEFRNSPSMTSLQRKRPPSLVKKNLAIDLDLASPLPDDDDETRSGTRRNMSLILENSSAPVIETDSFTHELTDTLQSSVQHVNVEMCNVEDTLSGQSTITGNPMITALPTLQMHHPSPINILMPFTISPPMTPTDDLLTASSIITTGSTTVSIPTQQTLPMGSIQFIPHAHMTPIHAAQPSSTVPTSLITKAVPLPVFTSPLSANLSYSTAMPSSLQNNQVIFTTNTGIATTTITPIPQLMSTGFCLLPANHLTPQTTPQIPQSSLPTSNILIGTPHVFGSAMSVRRIDLTHS